MGKENLLPNVSTLENTDFFRIVTELGLSKKVTGEILKAYIGGDTITKINDYYYFQDAANPVDNDYRFFIDGIYLRTQRYESSTWADVVVDGGSTTIQRILEITKDVNAEIYVNDNGQIRNLLRNATFSKGTVMGDVFGASYIITEDEVYKVKREGAEAWQVVQSNDTANSTGTTFYADVTTPPIDGFVTSRGRLKGVALPNGVKLQVKVFLQSDLINPIWENITDIEFENGEGADLDPVTSEYTTSPNFYSIGNAAVRLVINSSEEITLKGGDALATDMYFESYQAEVSFNSMTDSTTVKSQYEANSDTNAFTDAEKAKVSDSALKSNVLELDNTAPFTPVNDYEPTTVKFVQDLIGLCAGFKGVYADIAALELAHPTCELGSIATVTSPDGNLFYWNGSAWEDTGTGYLGDMLKLYYDPTGVNGDAFSMANMAESATKKILTDIERTQLASTATIAQINNTTGYANYLDSSTVSSPRVYGLNAIAPLINDKAILDGSRYPDGITSYWDSINKKFTPDQDNANYAFSVNFRVDATVRDKRLVVKFISHDAGGVGADVLIQERLVRLQKDTGDITPISISFTTGVTPAIVSKGVSVVLEFQDTGADVYDITCGLAKVGGEIT